MDLTHVIAERENKKIYRDGAKAIKVFAEGYSKADILNEALNTARVEETGLPIPKLLAVDTVNGQWAITTEFVEGDTLAALMAAHPEKEDEYLNLFVDIQMKVHACTCPMLNSLTEKMQRKISATDLDATTRYELHTRLASMHVHKKVCHGDFNPSNIIIAPDGQWYILDWSHATQGNASADVARTYLLFVLEGKEALAEEVPLPLLQEERHRQAVRPAVDSDRRREPVPQGQARRARPAHPLGKRLRIRIIIKGTGFGQSLFSWGWETPHVTIFPAFVEICHICNFPYVTNFSSSFFRGIIIIRRGNLPFSNLSAAIACQPPPQSA